MRSPGASGVVALALGLAACAGGGPDPGRCKIKVQSVEQWSVRTGAVDVTYRVTGEAGSSAKTWLVANPRGINPISGGGVDVGPGPFAADISLKLTGVPREFWAILEVQDPMAAKPKRCRSTAQIPGS